MRLRHQLVGLHLLSRPLLDFYDILANLLRLAGTDIETDAFSNSVDVDDVSSEKVE